MSDYPIERLRSDLQKATDYIERLCAELEAQKNYINELESREEYIAKLEKAVEAAKEYINNRPKGFNDLIAVLRDLERSDDE